MNALGVLEQVARRGEDRVAAAEAVDQAVGHESSGRDEARGAMMGAEVSSELALVGECILWRHRAVGQETSEGLGGVARDRPDV